MPELLSDDDRTLINSYDPPQEEVQLLDYFAEGYAACVANQDCHHSDRASMLEALELFREANVVTPTTTQKGEWCEGWVEAVFDWRRS